VIIFGEAEAEALPNGLHSSGFFSGQARDERFFEACFECGKYFLFQYFSCEIELILMKFLRDSYEISTFQTGTEPKQPSAG
jgi:hypothetical protein